MIFYTQFNLETATNNLQNVSIEVLYFVYLTITKSVSLSKHMNDG